MENINFFTLEYFIFYFAKLPFDWNMYCDFLTKPEVADFIEAKKKVTFKDDPKMTCLEFRARSCRFIIWLRFSCQTFTI